MIKKLLNLKLKFAKNQKGLTLIELLVVIVILGIIAAIAVPMVMGQQDKAAKNTNAQNLSILQDAVNRYYTMNNNTNPATLETLTLAESATGGGKGGPFLKTVPKIETFTDCTAATGTGAEKGWSYSAGEVSAPAGCIPS